MLMNAEQAAKQLGRDPALFRRWAASGKVKSVVKAGAIWIAEFDAWKAAADEVRKPGRKPKSALTPD